MLPKIIHLRFVELRRQDCIRRVLQEFERGAQTRDDSIVLDSFQYNLSEGWDCLLQFLSDSLVVQEVQIGVRLAEYFRQHFGDVVGFDDAAVSPDLDYRRIIDVPAVFLVRLIDDVDPFYERRKESGIDRLSQAFQHQALVAFGFTPFLDRELAPEGFFDSLAIGTEGRSETDEMGRRQRGSGDMKADSFQLRPDTGALCAVDILNNFVFNN